MEVSKMKTTNIMIVGVGGQGSLLASKLLGQLLVSENYDVKVSEVHGMSQRGGSVVTYVKYGEKVYSPVICDGEADFIISFETIEAARWVNCLKPEGKIIVSTQKMDPMPVIVGAAVYPENVLSEMKNAGITVDELDALTLAEEAGSSKAVNIVLMGRLARYLDIPKERWLEEIEKAVKPQFIDINKKAFMLGYNYSC
jgi:indolepyruvate ferredoxin oxidoreductase beta subunit